ncbi:MAG: hypothetical protein ACREXY_01325 [Gammaproteobacteria bacterium]
MTQAQAHEISRLRVRVRELEEALQRQKEATSVVLDREAKLLAFIERACDAG